MNKPDAPDKHPQEIAESADEDFYMDGPYCVFTEAFHLKRGFCCGSNCRHCPYKQDDSNPQP